MLDSIFGKRSGIKDISGKELLLRRKKEFSEALIRGIEEEVSCLLRYYKNYHMPANFKSTLETHVENREKVVNALKNWKLVEFGYLDAHDRQVISSSPYLKDQDKYISNLRNRTINPAFIALTHIDQPRIFDIAINNIEIGKSLGAIAGQLGEFNSKSKSLKN